MSRSRKTEIITITKEVSIDGAVDIENSKWLMAHLNAMANRQKNRIDTVALDKETQLLNKSIEMK